MFLFYRVYKVAKLLVNDTYNYVHEYAKDNIPRNNEWDSWSAVVLPGLNLFNFRPFIIYEA